MENKISISERAYKLLTILENRVIATKEELADELECSGKTIQNELNKLDDFFPEDWAITYLKGQGIKLKMPFDENVATVFKNEAELLHFDLYKILISNEKITLETLCDLIHYNKNSTVLLLKKLEKKMKKFGLILTRSPYGVEGNEGLKRLFIFEMIYSFKGPANFQVEPKNSKSMLLSEFLKEKCDLTISLYGLNTFIKYLDLSIQRINKGFTIENIEQFSAKCLENRDEFKKLDAFFEYIEEIYEVELIEDERKLLYFALIFTDISFNNSNLSEADKLLLDKVNDLINHIEKAFMIKDTVKDDAELVASIFTMYKIMLLKSDFLGMDYIPKKSILRSLKKEYHNFYKNMKMFIEEFFGGQDIHISESFIIRMTTFYAEHIENSPYIKVDAILLSSRTSFNNTHLLHTINSHFPSKLNLAVVSVKELEMDLSYIDLIITDTNIDFHCDTSVVLVHNVPTEYDFLKLDTIINEKLQQKINKILDFQPILVTD